MKTLSASTHANLLTFDCTINHAYPLALMIGREPNTAQQIDNVIGTYDFREYPRCGFWNVSYGMVANAKGLTARDLKQLCVLQRGSPIVHICGCTPYWAQKSCEEQV